jgi:hypothetical protein
MCTPNPNGSGRLIDSIILSCASQQDAAVTLLKKGQRRIFRAPCIPLSLKAETTKQQLYTIE